MVCKVISLARGFVMKLHIDDVVRVLVGNFNYTNHVVRYDRPVEE